MRRIKFARLPVAFLLLAGLTLTFAPQTASPAAANVITPSTLTICGTVSGYLAPSIYSNGYIIINGTTYSIEPQASLTNPALIASGAVICLQATFDASGAIIAAVVTTTAVAPVNLCGNVGPFLAPTSVAPGYIVVNNTTFPIAPGIFLPGWNLLAPNADVCLQATLNPYGQISYGSVLAATVGGPTQPFRACGQVLGFVPATPFGVGSVNIGGHQWAIAPGVIVPVVVGSNVCLDGTLNGALQIVSASVSAPVPNNVPVLACGTVTLFVPADAASTGVIVINGQTYTIAAGVLVAGANLAVPGANLCLSAALGPLNQIVSASLTVNGPAPAPVTQPAPQTLNVCGVVTDYTASTTTVVGLVSLGGKTFNIASGGSLTGAALLTSGTSVCIVATMNGAGQISSGTVSLNGNLQVTVCGLVQTYTAATSTTVGSITIGGATFPVAVGVVLTIANSTPLSAHLVQTHSARHLAF